MASLMNPTIELLKSHRSIRKFKDIPVGDEIARTIIETAQCAATSNHVQAYTVIRVIDKKAYDRITNTYYQTRDSNLKYQTWTGQIADFMSQNIRPHMKSFLQKQGFFIR